LKHLALRVRQHELMDEPGLSVPAHRSALVGLGRTNAICGVAKVIWRGIQKAGAVPTIGQPLRILDIAAGGGDVLVGVARMAARYGVRVEARGGDLNATAVEFAQQRADQSRVRGVRFFHLDALRDPLPAGYDVVMCTLFLHHLEEPQAVELLRNMSNAARKCVLVDDLRRTKLGFACAWVGCRLLTRSPIVHTDGPLSVQSAFTIDEVTRLADAAGLHGARFQRHWPQRFLMTWTKV
jgi:2-polyprenyl-3-methyl-5-hydroxy-6-metoxy-1,4-benzoquinol methylase